MAAVIFASRGNERSISLGVQSGVCDEGDGKADEGDVIGLVDSPKKNL